MKQRALFLALMAAGAVLPGASQAQDCNQMFVYSVNQICRTLSNGFSQCQPVGMVGPAPHCAAPGVPSLMPMPLAPPSLQAPVPFNYLAPFPAATTQAAPVRPAPVPAAPAGASQPAAPAPVAAAPVLPPAVAPAAAASHPAAAPAPEAALPVAAKPATPSQPAQAAGPKPVSVPVPVPEPAAKPVAVAAPAPVPVVPVTTPPGLAAPVVVTPVAKPAVQPAVLAQPTPTPPAVSPVAAPATSPARVPGPAVVVAPAAPVSPAPLAAAPAVVAPAQVVAAAAKAPVPALVEAPEVSPKAPAPKAAFTLEDGLTHFDFDRAELSAKGEAELNAWLEKASAKGKSLRVTGHADRIGAATYNLKLSGRRAEAVKQYLVGKGLAGRDIKLVAKGEAEPVKYCKGGVSPATIACLAPNRRVEIDPE